MGWFSKLLGRSSSKEAKSVDFSPEMWAAINGGWGLPTKSGGSVSATSAMQIMPFYRGVIALAEGVAQLPVQIYRKHSSGRGSEPAIDHPLYDLLLHQANNVQDGFQFWRTILMHAVGTGNAVAYKNIVNGQVKELIPVRPECVEIDIDGSFYERTYSLTFERGRFAIVGQDQVFHLCGPSWAHYKGMNPAVQGREALGLAQVTEEAHARLHANGSRPSGTLTAPAGTTLSPEIIERLRIEWGQNYSGTANVGKTPILTAGMDFKPIAQTGVDSEHLDTRKHQIEEIARLLGIFPIMLGHAGDQSPTFASAEAFMDAHVRYSLQPLIKAIISAVQMQLLTKEERAEGYHVRIDSSELLRGSLKDRTDYYKAALGTNSSPGWLSVNEIRDDDGWNAMEREGFDSPLTPADYGMGGNTGTDQTERRPLTE